MKVRLVGTAGAGGWPEAGCRCASCGRVQTPRRPFSVVIDDNVPLTHHELTRTSDGDSVLGPDGGSLLFANGDRAGPAETRPRPYDIVLIDLLERPDHLGDLRRRGLVDDTTQVVAVGLDHRAPSEAELQRRLSFWRALSVPDGTTLDTSPANPAAVPPANPTDPSATNPATLSATNPTADPPANLADASATSPGTLSATNPTADPPANLAEVSATIPTGVSAADLAAVSAAGVAASLAAQKAAPHRTLLLGGSRSGKSAEAELRLAAEPDVRYVATGPSRDDDPEWRARVAAHQARRPAHWRTIETTDLVPLLTTEKSVLLIDGIGTWLTAVIDAHNAWPPADPAPVLQECDALVAAWRQTSAQVIAVSEEVTLGVIPHTPSGRLFRDLLGTLNQRLATESEEAALIVAGRLLPLPF